MGCEASVSKRKEKCAPENSLLRSERKTSEVMRPMARGIGPDIQLPRRLSLYSFFISHTDSGISPVRLLCWSCSVRSSWRRSISCGISPAQANAYSHTAMVDTCGKMNQRDITKTDLPMSEF